MDGIWVTSQSVVLRNECVGNGMENPSYRAGIHVAETGKRIDGNTVMQNTQGIRVEGLGNLVVRNSARANPPAGPFFNYNIIGAGNTVGPVVKSANIATNGSVHANYEF